MTTIQIRNVPEDLSRTLKARAALEGSSLSDYLLGELADIATRPSKAELLQKLRSREQKTLPSAVDVLGEQRPGR